MKLSIALLLFLTLFQAQPVLANSCLEDYPFFIDDVLGMPLTDEVECKAAYYKQFSRNYVANSSTSSPQTQKKKKDNNKKFFKSLLEPKSGLMGHYYFPLKNKEDEDSGVMTFSIDKKSWWRRLPGLRLFTKKHLVKVTYSALGKSGDTSCRSEPKEYELFFKDSGKLTKEKKYPLVDENGKEIASLDCESSPNDCQINFNDENSPFQSMQLTSKVNKPKDKKTGKKAKKTKTISTELAMKNGTTQCGTDQVKCNFWDSPTGEALQVAHWLPVTIAEFTKFKRAHDVEDKLNTTPLCSSLNEDSSSRTLAQTPPVTLTPTASANDVKSGSQ